MNKKIQAQKEAHLDRLIAGGLLKRPDAYQILCKFTDTVRFVSRRLSGAIDKQIVLLAVLAYVAML